MGEFEYFLQLGSELEGQKNNLMAYGAYEAAVRRGDEKSRKVIESFLSVLRQNISSSAECRNREITESLAGWIREGKEAEAFLCYQEILTQLNGLEWIDHENAVLFHCLRIWMEEACQGEQSQALNQKCPEILYNWYYRLKFMARRKLAGLCGEEELSEFISANHISPTALEYMLHTVSIEPGYPAKEPPFCQETRTAGDIAFIIPVSEDEMFREAEYYIRHLQVPQGMTVEVLPIRGASSMTAAYNQGMHKTRARYKVYMHQDVMVLDPWLIYELCEIFQNPEIGLVGVAGMEKMPASGIWWENDGQGDYRNLYQDSVLNFGHTLHNPFDELYRRVEVIDGVFMAAQYDVLWREDIFQGWHFYDISQCMEFAKRGYQVVVAGQPYGVWCLHEQKYNKRLGEAYHREKEQYLHTYTRS